MLSLIFYVLAFFDKTQSVKISKKLLGLKTLLMKFINNFLKKIIIILYLRCCKFSFNIYHFYSLQLLNKNDHSNQYSTIPAHRISRFQMDE